VPDPTGTEVQAEDESQAAEDAAERLPADIDAAILRRYFTLSDADFGQIGQCRGASNKLGFVMWTFRGRVLKSTVGV